jgi:hypothetical protein
MMADLPTSACRYPQKKINWKKSSPSIEDAEIYHGQAAKLTKETLSLAGNAFAYLSHTSAVPI